MKNLLKYLVTRVLLTIPMLFILLTLVFVVLRVMPGDPVSAMLGDHAPAKVIAEKQHELGLDKPIYLQYVDYIWQLMRFDLGDSMVIKEKVLTPVLAKLPATVELTFCGMLVALGIGIPLGAWAARHRRSPGDFAARLYGNIVYCIPVFWMGLILQMIFGVALNWMPISGRVGSRVLTSDFESTGLFLFDTLSKGNFEAFGDVAMHLILPAITLGITLSGVFLRLTRANMLDSLKSDFVLAGRPGTPRTKGRLQPRAWQRLRPRAHHAGPAVRGPAGRCHPYRNHLQLARHGPAPYGTHLPSRLPDGAGRHRSVRPVRFHHFIAGRCDPRAH